MEKFEELHCLTTIQDIVENVPRIVDPNICRVRLTNWSEGNIFIFLAQDGEWVRHPKTTIKKYNEWIKRPIGPITIHKNGDYIELTAEYSS